jgi:putative ABC transport system permease protein
LGDRFHSSHGFTDDASLAHDDAQAFEIVGILAPTGTVIDQLILTTTQSFWLVHEHQGQEAVHEKGDSTVIEGAVNPPPSLLEASPDREITSLLVKFQGRNFQTLNLQRTINENTEMQAASPAIEINRLFTLIGSGEQVLRALAVVITVVSGISIFIALFSSLRDRRYELALMRVMGASPARLFFLLILEGLILAGLGYLTGLAISHGGMMVVASVMKSGYRYTFDAWQFLPQEALLLAGALLIGFLAALLPARQAAQTDIAETLSGG